MNEDENVNKYFLRVEETVNAMKGLGENIDEASLFQKILRSLHEIFNPKVYAIEELSDLKTLHIDQLLGIMTTYEMKIGKEKSTTREASFKEDKNNDFEMDVTEEKFVRRLKKGSGKYKGKMPFKCFNCGKNRPFAYKFSHKRKGQTSDDEENYKLKKYNKEDKYKKRILCANDVDS